MSIFVIFVILTFQIYSVYSQNTRDTQTYLQLLSSEVFLNSNPVSKDERYIISEGDIIRTWDSWRALIEWGDGSLTRIGENSQLRIDSADVNVERTFINIRFELLSWRTWSNVVSFLGSDSSFTQKIEWLDAGVRGTIFEVDMESWFIHVSEHVLELTNPQGDILILSNQTPFDIISWVFIDFDEFVTSFQDIAWAEFNKVSDIQYRQELLTNLQSSIERNNPFLKIMEWIFPHYRILYELDTSEEFTRTEELIENLSERWIQRTKSLIESRYQDFNFLTPDQENLYARKIRYQKALLILSDDRLFQQDILERSMLDLQSSINFWNTREVEILTSLLESYDDVIPHIDSHFVDTVFGWLWEEFWNEFQRTKDIIEDIFQIDISQISIESPADILDSASGTIENFLEDNFWDTIRNLLR